MSSHTIKSIIKHSRIETALIAEAKNIIHTIDGYITDAVTNNKSRVVVEIPYHIAIDALPLDRIQTFIYHYVIKAYVQAGFKPKIEIRGEHTFIHVEWQTPFDENLESKKLEFLRKYKY